MNRKLRRAQTKGGATGAISAAQMLADRAIQLLERGDARGAIEPLQRAIRQASDNADLHTVLGNAHFRLGEFDPAEQSIVRAIRLRPDDPDLHAFLGRVLLQRGRMVSAVQSFARALALDPGHWAAPELLEAKARVTQSIHSWHLPMLADLARNDAFEAAINRAVRPDDVLLDIGTGSGLLAMMAARAGARHVYACEMEPNLASLATEIVARNGFADRITIIGRKSTDLVIGADLPERATLLVTETFDSLLIGESAVTSIDHARAHLLTDDARIIPAGGRIIGQLCAMPRLKTLYPLYRLNGFDMSPLADLALEKHFYPVVPGQEEWTPLTAPVALIDFDFSQPARLPRDGRVTTKLTASGLVQALLLWIELTLDAKTHVSSGPNGSLRHWNAVLFLLDDAVTKGGDDITIVWRMDQLALYFLVE